MDTTFLFYRQTCKGLLLKKRKGHKNVFDLQNAIKWKALWDKNPGIQNKITQHYPVSITQYNTTELVKKVIFRFYSFALLIPIAALLTFNLEEKLDS